MTYPYNTIEPWKVQWIVSSDGRSITFSYQTGTQRIQSVYDGSRTWNYSYRSSTSSGTMLDRVTLPDNSYWQFNADRLNASAVLYLSSPSCDDEGGLDTTPAIGTMKHSSGATGSFTMMATTHGKSFVERICRIDATDGTTSAYFPRFFAHKSLPNKTITGPGLLSMAWNYSYSAATASSSWNTCTGTCPETKTVSVTDPRGYVTRYTVGNRHLVSEGQLQTVEAGWNGTTALRTTSNHSRDSAAGPYPSRAGVSTQRRGNGDFAGRYTPEDQRVITQQGVNFTWQASGFDTKARPATVIRNNTLGSSRTETTAYYDQTAKWALGQIASVTEASTGAVMLANSYDPSTANLLNTSRFGRLDQRFTHYPDGTQWTRADGLNQTTTFSNYKRGLAQNAQYADGMTESAVINDIGLITSVTDANAFTTNYGYDSLGRLNLITRPTTGDSVAWNTTSLAFEPVAGDEYGLSTGHWRQTVTTGNAKTITYFDALWRPRLTRSFDAANDAGTAKTMLRNFDADNRKVFESYPARTVASITATPPGTSTAYDGLGRPFKLYADSELGLLTTTIDYLAGFQKRVTNPRGYVSTTGYQVFDEPSESSITTLVAPETLNVSINRDVFGKPTSITRSGTTGGTGSATRSYVYDANQRLCKTIEPETGATVQAYDAANNTTWRASGLTLTSLICDPASVPAARKISYGYDARNRLTSTTFADGSPGITRTYKPDGLPATVTSDGTVLSYEYNKRRLLVSESQARSGGNWPVTHTYNPNGHTTHLTYPDSVAIAYAPNALGEASTVGAHASGVSYHPNGAVAGYTLGNGIVHSLTQKLRGLPEQNRDAGVMQDWYSYDANANVTGITDQQLGQNRSMGYDGLDRLAAANSPSVWGSGSYTYDALDNLRSSVVGARSSTHNHDGANRLSTINTNGAYTGYAYDVQGNITGRGTTGFYFDQANRMVWEGSSAWNLYDGLGRRVFNGTTGGVYKQYMYSQSGQMLFSLQQQGMVNRFKRHVYLGGKLIAEVDSATGVAEYVHTDALGSPVARTNSAGTIMSRTSYEAYGKTAAGTDPNGIGFTGHVSDPDVGLVYMQQRYYDLIAARFLSVDPVTTNVTDGSFFNRYVYGNNNPYKYKDPDGRAFETAWDIASLVLSVNDFRSNPSIGNALGVVVDAAAVAIPGVPGGVGAIRVMGHAAEAGGRAAKTEIHHVVPQADKRAAEARDVMNGQGINPKAEPTNKVALPGDKHDIPKRDSYIRDTNQRVAAQPNAAATKAECCKIADNLQKSTVDELKHQYPAK